MQRFPLMKCQDFADIAYKPHCIYLSFVSNIHYNIYILSRSTTISHDWSRQWSGAYKITNGLSFLPLSRCIQNDVIQTPTPPIQHPTTTATATASRQNSTQSVGNISPPPPTPFPRYLLPRVLEKISRNPNTPRVWTGNQTLMSSEGGQDTSAKFHAITPMHSEENTPKTSRDGMMEGGTDGNRLVGHLRSAGLTDRRTDGRTTRKHNASGALKRTHNKCLTLKAVTRITYHEQRYRITCIIKR